MSVSRLVWVVSAAYFRFTSLGGPPNSVMGKYMFGRGALAVQVSIGDVWAHGFVGYIVDDTSRKARSRRL
jgi:hypothetical protein